MVIKLDAWTRIRITGSRIKNSNFWRKRSIVRVNYYLQVTEALGQSTAWTGNGDKSGLDGASDTFVNSDFLGVMKKFHFFAIRILNINRISLLLQTIKNSHGPNI